MKQGRAKSAFPTKEGRFNYGSNQPKLGREIGSRPTEPARAASPYLARNGRESIARSSMKRGRGKQKARGKKRKKTVDVSGLVSGVCRAQPSFCACPCLSSSSCGRNWANLGCLARARAQLLHLSSGRVRESQSLPLTRSKDASAIANPNFCAVFCGRTLTHVVFPAFR